MLQYRYAGMGMEFAGAVALFALLGWWLDRSFSSDPLWLVSCTTLGLVGGMYQMIRRAIELQRRITNSERRRASGRDDTRSD